VLESTADIPRILEVVGLSRVLISIFIFSNGEGLVGAPPQDASRTVIANGINRLRNFIII
jgi:hypothetical protein